MPSCLHSIPQKVTRSAGIKVVQIYHLLVVALKRLDVDTQSIKQRQIHVAPHHVLLLRRHIDRQLLITLIGIVAQPMFRLFSDRVKSRLQEGNNFAANQPDGCVSIYAPVVIDSNIARKTPFGVDKAD